MLRGLATVSYWADDLRRQRSGTPSCWASTHTSNARTRRRRRAGDPGYDRARPAYIEFRLGDYQHELGIIDSRYAPDGAASGPAGAVVYWHVDDVPATFEKLLAMGAKEHQPLTARGEEGFVTASVVDPFGNMLGIMYNPHYLEVLDSSRRA